MFNDDCSEEGIQIQKDMCGMNIYAIHLREVSLNDLPYWLTGIFIFFKVVLRNYRDKRIKPRNV